MKAFEGHLNVEVLMYYVYVNITQTWYSLILELVIHLVHRILIEISLNEHYKNVLDTLVNCKIGLSKYTAV